MTREFIDFVNAHQDEDTAKLLLSASRYPSVDMPLAVQQIEGRRTARDKWPGLLEYQDYLYPPRLNREQASSEATARYKAEITGCPRCVADLTGGMGIDSLAFARMAKQVDYVERDPALVALMEHNRHTLGLDNIHCYCADSLAWLTTQGTYDLLFIDPARRGAAGRKVAAFEDCTPDIIAHLPLLRQHSRQLLVKASPMIDITLACQQLRDVAAVHIVAHHGECKEVLFLCREHDEETSICCVNLNGDETQRFTFCRSDEAAAPLRCCDTIRSYLYDPHAALRKGGCFRLLGQQYDMLQLAPNTHLYTSDQLREDFPGRTFEVLREVKPNKKGIAEALPEGKAHVVTRNYPVAAAELQKQLGLKEGGDLFVVATSIGTRRTGLLCRQI